MQSTPVEPIQEETSEELDLDTDLAPSGKKGLFSSVMKNKYVKGAGKALGLVVLGAVAAYSWLFPNYAKASDVQVNPSGWSIPNVSKARHHPQDGRNVDLTDKVKGNETRVEVYSNSDGTFFNTLSWNGKIYGFIVDTNGSVPFEYNVTRSKEGGPFDYKVLMTKGMVVPDWVGILTPEELAKQYIKTGETKYGKGDLEGAMADFKEAVKANPEDWEGYNNIAAVHAERKEFGKALPFAKKAYGLNPKNCKLVGRYAYVNAKLHNNDEAIRLFEEELSLCPGDQTSIDWLNKLRR